MRNRFIRRRWAAVDMELLVKLRRLFRRKLSPKICPCGDSEDAAALSDVTRAVSNITCTISDVTRAPGDVTRAQLIASFSISGESAASCALGVRAFSETLGGTQNATPLKTTRGTRPAPLDDEWPERIEPRVVRDVPLGVFVSGTQLYNLMNECASCGEGSQGHARLLLMDARPLNDYHHSHILGAVHASYLDDVTGVALDSYDVIVLYDQYVYENEDQRVADDYRAPVALWSTDEPLMLADGFDQFRAAFPFYCTDLPVRCAAERLLLFLPCPAAVLGAPGLYLGSARHAADRRVIDVLRITHVVNATRNCAYAFPDQLTYLRVAAEDENTENLLARFVSTTRFIHEALHTASSTLLGTGMVEDRGCSGDEAREAAVCLRSGGGELCGVICSAKGMRGGGGEECGEAWGMREGEGYGTAGGKREGASARIWAAGHDLKRGEDNGCGAAGGKRGGDGEGCGAVLVHCSDGRSRGAALVIAYVMQTLRLPLALAHRHVAACGHVAPRRGFLLQLARLEERLFGSRLTDVESLYET